MPVYIRKNVSFTPPSIYNMQMEDDNDYLLDPDQMRDILPQPYRMINKLLTQLIDSVWEIVDSKENALLAEARKVRPPRFDEAQELNLYHNATALEASADGKIIFVGLAKGLAAMDALTQTELHSWEGEERMDIVNIKAYLIGPDFHFLVTIDDMAIVRLLLFAYGRFFFVKTVNENSPEATSKILCQKCEASKDGEYAGFVLENTVSKEVWLEVHKVPIENWLKDLNSIGAAVEKHKETVEAEDSAESVAETPAQPAQPAQPTQAPTSTAAGLSSQPSSSDIVIDNALLDKLGIKFSPPAAVLKVRSPPELPLPANTSSSLGSAVQKVDTGDVLGTGLHHVLGAAHLESRDAMFQHRHENMMKYLPEEKEEQAISLTFHFVPGSRMISHGLDQGVPDQVPVAVAVWWAGSPHLLQYSLLKTGKDLDIKPEIVWPLTSTITCSAISPCASHLAVGQENGNIILWNRQLGIHKAVLRASSTSPVKTIRFLDPCLFPGDPPHYPPYPIASATFLLVECSDGSQMLFDTCDGSQQIPRCIAGQPENEEDLQTLMKVIPNLPELMVYVQKNGNMYIKDIGTGAALCQIAVPATHQIQTPWDPVFAIGGGGQILYLKAEGTEVGEDGEVTDISGVFMYHLRSYPVLDDYWAREHHKRDLHVYTTLEQRVSALMHERVQQQGLRKPRMQRRWGQLRSELDIIQQARLVPVDSCRIEF